MASPDLLFNLRNLFYLGAYQAAINNIDIPGLDADAAAERDAIVFCSYIALGSYQLVINEIDSSAATSLQAVKLLALYLTGDKDWMRFSVAFWHTFCGTSADPFGAPTMTWPWEDGTNSLAMAKRRMRAHFEFMEKLGVNKWCFHDRDIAPDGKTLEETNSNLDEIVQLAKQLQVTHYLGGENYVFWGGREGYQTLLNTDMKRELDHLANFLQAAVDYKKKIGFNGNSVPYDWDVATTFAFLQKYGLTGEFKINVECNHATLSGHRKGWDTDQFMTDIAEATLVMSSVVKNGGLAPGGFNFDAKFCNHETIWATTRQRCKKPHSDPIHFAEDHEAKDDGPHRGGDAGVQLQANRWLVFVAAMWLQSMAGIRYLFGAISPVMKAALGYNQCQVAALGVAKDLGDCVGFLAGSLSVVLPSWAMLLIGSAQNFLGYGWLWLIVTRQAPALPLWMMTPSSATIAVGRYMFFY
ncbi:Xylose isomerase [Zea mays]|uniref:xylose isomerase n=1 Tax=Zea mays TaxID=4577 RepID=A0A3L6F0A9_MAIZE|nr:Xylose isomerase [Zea mays]